MQTDVSRHSFARCRPAWFVLPTCLVSSVSGCSAAPSQNILGSFFPAWILCAVLGVIAAVIFRRLLVAVGISDHLIAPPLVYLALAVSGTLLAWLMWFGG